MTAWLQGGKGNFRPVSQTLPVCLDIASVPVCLDIASVFHALVNGNDQRFRDGLNLFLLAPPPAA